MQRPSKFHLWYVIFAILGVLLLRDTWETMQQVQPLPYSEVTDIARSMVVRYGMDDKLGNIVYEEERPFFLNVQQMERRPRSYSEMTAREIDVAVRDIVSGVFQNAVDILSRRRRELETAARKLMEKETLSEEDLAGLKEAVRAVA